MSGIVYQVQVLKVGEADVRGPEVYWMSAWDDWETLYFYMLVLHGNGKTIVVNTGPPRELADMNKLWVEGVGHQRGAMRVTDQERPWNALPNVGVDPAQVDYVLVTPFQAYTTANLDLFPNATFCLSRKGWVDFHAPKHPVTQVTRRQSFTDRILTYLSTKAWDRMRLLNDEEEITPGIRTFWVGAHHRSSIAISIDTAKGSVVYSDCCFKYANIEEDRLLGITESLEETREAYSRMRKEADIFIPGYDPEVLQRYPGGLIA
ncbi:MAG: hypothetical protein ABGX16_05745 [Pirellulales bacterium]